MKKKTRWTALLLALCLCLALTACGGKSPGEAESPSPTPEQSGQPSPAPSAGPRDGLTVRVGAEPGSIDPTAVASQNEIILTSHMFEGLMKWAPSGRSLSAGVESAQVVPGMAETYERAQGEDGRVTYTFHLRQNAKWSDGKAVTAHDFVYAWQRLLAPEHNAQYAGLLADVAGVDALKAGQAQVADLGLRAVDDATFEVTLTQEVPWFLELCAMPFTAPVRQDVVEEVGNQWTYGPETYMTNGPYKLKSWSHNLELVAEKDPEYYESVAGPQTITFSFYTDVADGQSAYDAGNLDFLLGADPAGEKVEQAPYLASYYVMFQTGQAPFDNALVRQAFALAVDRSKLIENQAPGQTPAGALVPTGTVGPDGAAGADFRAHAGDCFDPAAKTVSANREKAKTLLSQAGYPGGAGFPEVTYLCPNSPAQAAVGEALAQMWQETLGVTVTVESVEWSVFLQRCHQGEFSMARGRWVADYNDPTAFLDLWRTGEPGNDAGYREAQYDELLDRADQADDPSRRMELLAQAEDLLIGRDYALAPLYFESESYLMKEGVKGVYYSPLGWFFFVNAQVK